MTSSRPQRATCAADTLACLERGHYSNPQGRQLDLTAALATSLRETRTHRRSTFTPRPARRFAATTLALSGETTMAAMQRLARTASASSLGCLNFASAKNPGGGFLSGAQAQEECLARSSTLYPSLLSQTEFYEAGRACGSCLYEDTAIISPRVVFFKDDAGEPLAEPYEVTVITCPAPNAGAIRRNEPARIAAIEPTLRRRADFVLRLAVESGVEQLVLGAWGCGVFQNDPRDVAAIFAELLAPCGTYDGAFRLVQFAVYDPSPGRAIWQAFQQQLIPR